MRILITGSRTWTGPMAEAKIAEVLEAFETLATVLGEPLIVRHGACPEGADAIADRWLLRRGYEPERFPADWARHGRSAGPLRNRQMAASQQEINHCVGFRRDGLSSRGTTDCLLVAIRNGIPTTVIEYDSLF